MAIHSLICTLPKTLENDKHFGRNVCEWMRTALTEVNVALEWLGFSESVLVHAEVLERLTAVCVMSYR